MLFSTPFEVVYKFRQIPMYLLKNSHVVFSLKNIPVPSEKSSILHLMEMVEMVIKRMKWRVICYTKTGKSDKKME